MEHPHDLIEEGKKLNEAIRVLKLLHDKCRQVFLEISQGDEAYDELQKIMK